MTRRTRTRRRKSATKPQAQVENQVVETPAATSNEITANTNIEQFNAIGTVLANAVTTGMNEALSRFVSTSAAVQYNQEQLQYIEDDRLPAHVADYVRQLVANGVTSFKFMRELVQQRFGTYYKMSAFMGYSSWSPNVNRRARRTQNEIAQNRALAAKHGVRI